MSSLIIVSYDHPAFAAFIVFMAIALPATSGISIKTSFRKPELRVGSKPELCVESNQYFALEAMHLTCCRTKHELRLKPGYSFHSPEASKPLFGITRRTTPKCHVYFIYAQLESTPACFGFRQAEATALDVTGRGLKYEALHLEFFHVHTLGLRMWEADLGTAEVYLQHFEKLFTETCENVSYSTHSHQTVMPDSGHKTNDNSSTMIKRISVSAPFAGKYSSSVTML